MAGQGARLGLLATSWSWTKDWRTGWRQRWRGGVFRTLAVALSIATMTGVSHAGTLAEAQEAFDRGRFDRAARIWRELARDGEPEAAFRLGLLSDLGLGTPSDPVEAFERYLEAARQGHATAQFNVGVMLDAGLGPLWSPTAASTWYARAAIKGFARAEYNLALLYVEGDGLPRNIALARAWMSRAAITLPAARERLGKLRELDPQPPELPVAPVPLAASVVPAPEGDPTLELVWSADEQPPGTRYRVELEGASGDAGSAAVDRIEVSAVAIPLPSGKPRRWRVLAIDGERSATSYWRPLSGAPDKPFPGGRIAIRFGSDDALGRAFAEELAGIFTRSGLRVETASIDDVQIVESEVRYFFDDDASLAHEIAMALPVLAGRAVFQPGSGHEPGAIEVRLRGGPAR